MGRPSSLLPGLVSRMQPAVCCFVRRTLWSLTGRTLHSLWMCSWLDISRQPEAVLRPWFWIVWSFVQLVGLMVGDHMGVPYSRVLRTTALYVIRRVSLSCPHDVPARDLIALILPLHFLTVSLIWCPKCTLYRKLYLII